MAPPPPPTARGSVRSGDGAVRRLPPGRRKASSARSMARTPVRGTGGTAATKGDSSTLVRRAASSAPMPTSATSSRCSPARIPQCPCACERAAGRGGPPINGASPADASAGSSPASVAPSTPSSSAGASLGAP